MIPIPFLATGAVAGAGAGLLVRELWPGPPDLSAALARLHGTAPAPAYAGPGAARLAIRDRVGAAVLARADAARWLTVPRADLAVLARSPQRYAANKLLAAASGLVLGPYLAVLALLLGHPLSPAVPVLAAPAISVLLWFAVDRDVKAAAGRARHEMEWALTAYLDLVCMHRAGDAGIVEALEESARACEGWVFVRLRDALALARTRRIPPWEGLGGLAEELAVPALRDIADIASWSGREGASVYTALRARAEGMRRALGNREAEKAAASTVRLTTVGALLGLLLMLLIGYPAFTRILGG